MKIKSIQIDQENGMTLIQIHESNVIGLNWLKLTRLMGCAQCDYLLNRKFFLCEIELKQFILNCSAQKMSLIRNFSKNLFPFIPFVVSYIHNSALLTRFLSKLQSFIQKSSPLSKINVLNSAYNKNPTLKFHSSLNASFISFDKIFVLASFTRTFQFQFYLNEDFYLNYIHPEATFPFIYFLYCLSSIL